MSLRLRLIITYTLIIIICLSMVAVVVSVILQRYSDRFIASRLDDMTVPIYVQTRSLAKRQVPLDDVWSNLKEQAQSTGVYILVVDMEGNIVRQILPQGSLEKQTIELPPESLPSDISKPYHGTFVTSDGQTFIFAAYPFRVLFIPQTSAALESIVLAVPRSSILTLWLGLIRPFLWAGLIAFCISVVIAFLVARSVYRPIQRVTEAADMIAQGDYDQEIPVEGPAEVRGLASGFNNMAREVKMSQKKLRDFVADVSHQLRNPLTSIRGFAQAMLDGTASDEDTRLRAARVIEDESKRMIRQVDELLELSRMQSGQTRLAKEAVEVRELIEHCWSIIAAQAEEKGVLLKMEMEPFIPVSGDADRLEQVFTNLLDNALKHSPHGGEINISGRQLNGKNIEIIVADNGPGIPPEQLPYVFDRFYQAGEVRTGVGLGLAIVREIVVAHGGEIGVTSTPGKGAQFIVTLPADTGSISEE
ncbi:MAG: HAMP domain-containing histidine kinase [Dehalococcoidales bacterium]|nr:MAG: HAMP domain-containing histidine kinase [Dehalococcoidales bacterium]